MAGTAGGETGVVEGLLEVAVQALRQGRRHAYDAAVAPLEVKRDGWSQVVEQVLVSHLRASVATVWRRGWQPADLARIATRRLDARHVLMLGDVVVDELGTYAPTTVDPAWPVQLAEMDAARWWPTDRTYLAARRGRLDADAAHAVTCAVELIHLLVTLPPLELLAAVPGTHRPQDAARVPVDDRVLSRVRALLAKAESTTFPAEAETFTAGAQALMARHSIDAAVLAATTPRAADAIGRRIGLETPYEAPKALLIDAVARANRCRSVWTKQLGFATVVGFAPDLDAVEALFTSLLVQATTAVNREGTGSRSRTRSRSFRQSFLTAYAVRIGERLAETAAAQTAEAAASMPGTDLLPVLAARSQAVDDTVNTLFPTTKQRSVSSVGDWEGFTSGTSAADRASLDGHRQAVERHRR